MTRNGNLKRLVRARAAKTGESYAAALRSIRQAGQVPPRPPLGRSMFRIAARSWWRAELIIAGENDDVLVTASWRPGFPTGTWTIQRADELFATMRWKALSPLRTCVVEMNGATFLLRNRFALSRIIEVQGGPFDGATLSGTFGDHKFRLERESKLIAEAQADLLSPNYAHVAKIRAGDDPAAEQLATLMMINLIIQKREEM